MESGFRRRGIRFMSAANRVINDEKVKKYSAKIALIMKFY